MTDPSLTPADFFRDNEALLPAIVQEARLGKVLMLGYMNREALERTIASGLVTFFSRSRGRLWTKGESSGHVLRLSEIRWDCDRDTFLVLADPEGPTCHTGSESCFDGRILFQTGPPPPFETLSGLLDLIHRRREASSETSYVARLLSGPKSQLLKKLVEEAGETMAAVFEGDRRAIASEMADLLFHLLVTMEREEVSWSDLFGILGERTGTGGLAEKQSRTQKIRQPGETP